MSQFKYNFDKLLEHRIRLGIMSMLMVEDWVDFNTLKENLGATDGNLATHIISLEKKKYINIRKIFVSKKPQTSYRATAIGKKAFAKHIDAMELFIKDQS